MINLIFHRINYFWNTSLILIFRLITHLLFQILDFSLIMCLFALNVYRYNPNMVQLHEKIAHKKYIVCLVLVWHEFPRVLIPIFSSRFFQCIWSIQFLIWVRKRHEAHVSNCPYIIRVMCHSKIRQTLYFSFTY